MDEYYLIASVVIILILLIYFMNSKQAKSFSVKHDTIRPDFIMSSFPNGNEYTENAVSRFNSDDINGVDSLVGIGENDTPQLNENKVESAEYKQAMRVLIKFLLKSYNKETVGSYIDYIKEKGLNPSLVLAQMQNNPYAIQRSLS